jgi:hypothetical protein
LPRVPASQPSDSPRCDARLPEAALTFRMTKNPRLTTSEYLRAINVTAWLYRDKEGVERIQVNPNTTIVELLRQFGPAATPDAEVGIHSEAKAAEWFRIRPAFRVLKIFSERIPCPMMCAPMLRHYFSGVPWYYYYDRKSWLGPGGKPVKTAAEILKTAYGL